MKRPPLPLSALLFAGLAASVPGQSIALARESGQGSVDLVSIDEGSLATTTALADVTLLDIALAGRPLSERFRADRPTAHDDGVAPRVRLPSQGSLYRTRTGGATQLVLVRPDGAVDVLLERPSTSEPTLLPQVAVSDDGSRVLVGTTAEQGGDVLAIRIDAAPTVELLTPTAAPLVVAGESLRVSTTAAWFVGDGAVFRARLGAGGSGAVPAAYQPGEVVHPELAMAANGRRAAWITELPGGARHVWAAELLGDATRQSATAGAYDPPGYADAGGPWLVVDAGAPWIAWRERMPLQPTGTSDEVFARRITTPTPAAWLTADGQFTDTIDSVGGLGFVANGLLTFFAGEPADEPGQLIGSADLYLADLTQPGNVSNLTMTSGEPGAPFLQTGELEVLDVFDDPTGARRLLLVDPSGGDYGLLSQDVAGGPLTTLLGGLEVAPTFAAAGDSLFAQVFPPPLVPGDPRQELLLLRPDGSLDPIVETTALIAMERFAVSRDGTRAAFVASAGPDLEIGLRLDLATAGLELLWPGLLHWAPRLAFSASGHLAAGLGLPGGPFLFVAFDGPATGFVLPGGVSAGFPLDG